MTKEREKKIKEIELKADKYAMTLSKERGSGAWRMLYYAYREGALEEMKVKSTLAPVT